MSKKENDLVFCLFLLLLYFFSDLIILDLRVVFYLIYFNFIFFFKLLFEVIVL